jgi:hypothetical protein
MHLLAILCQGTSQAGSNMFEANMHARTHVYVCVCIYIYTHTLPKRTLRAYHNLEQAEFLSYLFINETLHLTSTHIAAKLAQLNLCVLEHYCKSFVYTSILCSC